MNPFLLTEGVPVSCKGKKDVLGRPLLWNDSAQRCKPLGGRFQKKLHAAQEASAKAIAASQQTHVGLKKHHEGAKANEDAILAHHRAAQEFHHAGFSSVAQVLAKQASLHATLAHKHHERAEKAGEKKPEEQKPSGELEKKEEPSHSGEVTPTQKPAQGGRDHRGRFARK